MRFHSGCGDRYRSVQSACDTDARGALLADCFPSPPQPSEQCLARTGASLFNRGAYFNNAGPYYGGSTYDSYYANNPGRVGSSGFGLGVLSGLMGGGLGYGRFGGGFLGGFLGGGLLGGLLSRLFRGRGGGCGGGGWQPDYSGGGQWDDYSQRDREERRRRDELDEESSQSQQRRHKLPTDKAEAERVVDNVSGASDQQKERAKSLTSFEAETLKIINEKRASANLKPLEFDPRLQLVALHHSEYQNKHGLGHTEGTNGWRNVASRLAQVGLRGWRENAAYGVMTPRQLVDMWMASDLHRAALLAPETRTAGISKKGYGVTFNTV